MNFLTAHDDYNEFVSEMNASTYYPTVQLLRLFPMLRKYFNCVPLVTTIEFKKIIPCYGSFTCFDFLSSCSKSAEISPKAGNIHDAVVQVVFF